VSELEQWAPRDGTTSARAQRPGRPPGQALGAASFLGAAVAGSVLVQHPRLIHQQHITGAKDSTGQWALVRVQLVTLPGRAPCLAPPKTAASVRTIPLPQVVVDALASHLREFPASRDVLVFTIEGEPITRQVFGHLWRPVVKAAGLPAGTGFHSLRHYFASLLIRHGESVKTVQARLGHASAVETLDTYSHLWPDSDDRTREAVDSVLGNLAVNLRSIEASKT
jgi:integrase